MALKILSIYLTYYRTESNLFSDIAFCKVSFFIWDLFHKRSRFTGQQRKGEAISLTPLYHLDPLHRHLDINWANTTENRHRHIPSSPTQT